jgi:hypothetical protein
MSGLAILEHPFGHETRRRVGIDRAPGSPLRLAYWRRCSWEEEGERFKE